MLDLFSRLSSKEVKEFGNFLKSPFFNKNKDLIKIYDYLGKIQINYIADIGFEEKLLQDLKFSSEKKRLVREFRVLIEQYLIYKQFEADENTRMMYELKALHEKNEHKYYKRKLNDFIKKFDNKYKRDENYYSNRVLIEGDYYYLTLNDHLFDYPEILDRKRDNIIHNFYFQLLHCYNDMMIHQGYAGKDFGLKFPYLNEILTDISNNAVQIRNEHPNIYVIYLTILISQKVQIGEDTWQLEKEYIAYLEKNIHKFDNSQLFHYYLYLINYYWDLVHLGKLEYREKIFQIYKYAEMNNFIFLNNKVDAENFSTIVSAATTTNNVEWAEYFIQKYKFLLDLETSKDFLNLIYVRIYYLKKDYKKSLHYLSLVGGKNPDNFINAKIFFCKIYYENKDFNGIEIELENLRKYGERNKRIQERLKEGIDNFGKYMKGLLKVNELFFLKDRKYEEMANYYCDQISDTQYFIPQKQWFLEKFNEVINK